MGTITKALKLLNFLAPDTPDLGLAEFTRLTGQDKATVYRHLRELEENGFLELDPMTKRYRLGPAVLRLANVRDVTLPAREAIAPIARRLSQNVGELVHVSMLQGDALSCLAYADINVHGTRVHFDEAVPLPLHATASGIALIAYSGPDLLAALLEKPLQRYTQFTFGEPGRIRRAVAATRSMGFCIMDRTYDEEVASIAVPVFGKHDKAAGALAVAVPISRMTGTLESKIKSELAQGGEDVSKGLGGLVREELKEAWRHAA